MTDPPVIRSQFLDGIEYRYSSDWIHRLEKEEHWRFYWQQANLVLNELEAGDTILEIGPGSGFLSNYLRSKGFNVTTLDIDEQKFPDIVANIVEYSFPDRYDHVMAFEVFEHIPYSRFIDILSKLKKSVRKNIFFSLPRNYKIWFHAELIIPYFKNISLTFKTRRNKIKERNHFWELDYKEYNIKNLVRTIQEAGFYPEKIHKVKLVVFLQLKPET